MSAQRGVPTEVLDASRLSIARAGGILAAGGLVVIPTETVYGLAARADSARAVRAIFAAKGRPADNPLIVHYATVAAIAADFRPAAALSSCAVTLLEQFAPGPLTLVLTAPSWVPAVVRAGLPSVAVRVPAHPVAREVIAAAGGALAAPSANRSGRPSPTDAGMALQEMDGRAAAIVDGGPAQIGIESTVIDARDPERLLVLRAGAIDAAQLRNACSCQVVDAADDDRQLSAALAPGMRHAHYRPSLPVYWFTAQQRGQVALWATDRLNRGEAIIVLLLAPLPDDVRPPTGQNNGAVDVRVFEDEPAYARGLYRALTAAERSGALLVAAELPTAHAGLSDRIRRAATASWSQAFGPTNDDNQQSLRQ